MIKTSKDISELLTLRSCGGKKKERKTLCRIKIKQEDKENKFQQFVDMFGPIEKQIYEYLKLDGRLKYD